MPILSAKFKLDVTSPCLIQWPDGEVPAVSLQLGEFAVHAKLLLGGTPSKNEDDTDWIRELRTLEIGISREERDSTPDIIETPDGKRDLSVRSTFLGALLPEYRDTAYEVANRIMRFFQYSLSTPLVRPSPTWSQSLSNPSWTDANGMVVMEGTRTIVGGPMPGRRGELGVEKLTPEKLPDLQAFLETPKDVSLAAALLSDAQTAWFEGSLRRSVLELAICVEILVKRRFFSEASPAGAAFDYLEDKARVQVRVLELLDAISDEAFGRSYKRQEPDNFRRIRCRNKIAHRGELSFRDESGTTIFAEEQLVKSWWEAVAHLNVWLHSF